MVFLFQIKNSGIRKKYFFLILVFFILVGDAIDVMKKLKKGIYEHDEKRVLTNALVFWGGGRGGGGGGELAQPTKQSAIFYLLNNF